MGQESFPSQRESDDSEFRSTAHFVHTLLRFVLAIRYRKNVVAAVIVVAVLLGGLYYMTAQRRYSAKSVLLVTQTGRDRLNTSIANEDASRQNNLPTFENMVRSAKVLEGAIKNLAPADRVDLGDGSLDRSIDKLKKNLSVKTVRNTSILDVSYNSRDPQVAVNVVRAIVQSYLDFMDRMHKGTAGEISRMLTKEREQVADKLNAKQQELLECRRHFADMGFRSDGKTLHPTVQRAVFFNDALIAAQKTRVEQEALLASVQTAIQNGQDLGQYIMSVGDAVGREMLLSSLGLSSNNANTQATLEGSLLAARAELQTAQQNLGPMHPEVVALTEKIRLTERFLASAQQRIGQRMTELDKAQLGPWLLQIVQQKVDESRKKELSLIARFEETRAEAVNLSGQLVQIETLERDVKRLSDMNDVLLNQIASLDLKQTGSEVRVAVIEEPVMDASPVSPRLSYVAILVVVGGFGVAVSLVALLDALDDRFQSVDEMQSRLGLPLLTMIQRMETSVKVGVQALISHVAPTSVESECFRTLRTALNLTHPDAHQIVVTSAEPGDGKTTVLANLAVCYAQADKRVLLIDADMRRPGLSNLMKMRGPHGLSEVLRSDGDISRIAPMHIQPSGAKGLDIMPCGPRPTDPAELLGNPQFPQMLSWAETVYDVILIDSPPSLATTDAIIISRYVDGVLLVVQPAKNRRRLAMRVVERLNMMKANVLGMIVNRTGSEEEQGYYGYHHYGYGQGYGYGYGKEKYGSDEESAPSEDAAAERVVPFAEEHRTDADEEEGLVIPRRVA